MTKPLVLCILDGVGIAKDKKHNAVQLAKMPYLRKLLKKYPHSELNASGTAVGLTPGTMGNSEVGHIAIGTGRIVNQFLRRFQLTDLHKNKPLKKFIADVKRTHGNVHLIGMTSDGKVHSDISQQIEVAKIIMASGLKIIWHFIADGRDTPPQSAEKYINKLYRTFRAEIKSGQMIFGTLSGRYYAMDRNNNWDRTTLAFDAIAKARADYAANDIRGALRDAYNRGESDEFIKPTVIANIPTKESDGILFTNYRSDRARQILKMITMPGVRPKKFKTPNMLCFSEYGEGLDELCPALLPDVKIKDTLGDVLAANNLSQLRIAETEKYNHATYFFDAERTMDYPRGTKLMIPSPSVATFDLKPEMAAIEITDALIPRLPEFDVVILNYANGDMVGHTGNQAATIKAMETLDTQLSRLIPAVLELDGTILITADHGNAEKMWNDKLGTPWTAHTTSRVMLLAVGNNPIRLKNGGLADIAPTMLEILGIKQPRAMTGTSLIK